MTYTKNDVVGQIVADNYKTARIFSNHGIDFCCSGNRTIKEVCGENNVPAEELISNLNQISISESGNHPDFISWELDLLADYIEKKHHRYVRQQIQEILPYLNKVVEVHGRSHPELIEIACEFEASAIELNGHIHREELDLFPYIRHMVESNERKETPVPATFGDIKYPIRTMMEEHDHEGVRFRKIRKLSNDFIPPADACQTYRVTFSLLEEFEQDLHQHIHLENNILFPKSADLERKMNHA